MSFTATVKDEVSKLDNNEAEQLLVFSGSSPNLINVISLCVTWFILTDDIPDFS